MGGITPACAGSTNIKAICLRCWKDHPRLRGEYTAPFSFVNVCLGSPPLARGVRTTRQTAKNGVGITPACAGSTSALYCCHKLTQDHPRLRGEYNTSAKASITMKGSPPLARGVLSLVPSINLTKRIIPACAGSTVTIPVTMLSSWDHPRLRGEYAIFTTSAKLFCWIIPACAGSTLYATCGPSYKGDHPRLRGEYKPVPKLVLWLMGSSPLARGVHLLQRIHAA